MQGSGGFHGRGAGSQRMNIADGTKRVMNQMAKQGMFNEELYKKEIDMSKITFDSIKPWIKTKVIEIMGFEDDIVIEYVNSQLTFEKQTADEKIEPKKFQMNLTPFLGKQTPEFCQELWELLISAMSEPSGIPKRFVEEKKMEMDAKRLKAEQIGLQLQNQPNVGPMGMPMGGPGGFPYQQQQPYMNKGGGGGPAPAQKGGGYRYNPMPPQPHFSQPTANPEAQSHHIPGVGPLLGAAPPQPFQQFYGGGMVPPQGKMGGIVPMEWQQQQQMMGAVAAVQPPAVGAGGQQHHQQHGADLHQAQGIVVQQQGSTTSPRGQHRREDRDYMRKSTTPGRGEDEHQRGGDDVERRDHRNRDRQRRRGSDDHGGREDHGADQRRDRSRRRGGSTEQDKKSRRGAEINHDEQEGEAEQPQPRSERAKNRDRERKKEKKASRWDDSD
ncbi:unnamed protein product [Amoebophrya sp. A120]|nr:unnamed protein product [Amoebophrya sp. A120]|eukprot:GSA120T00008913001.1